MSTISDDEADEVTIDGEDVQEITMDGDVVWEAMTVYEDFEHNNLSGHWSGELNHFSISTNQPWEGSYSLRVPTVGGSRMINYDAVPPSEQPGIGDNFSCWFYSTGSDVGQGVAFCDEAVTERNTESAHYELSLRTSGGPSRLFYRDSNGNRVWEEEFRDLEPYPASLDPHTWYRAEVYFRTGDGPFSSDEIGISIRQTDGTEYQRGSTTRLERTSGYLGAYSPHDKPTHYYDYFSDQVGADTI